MSLQYSCSNSSKFSFLEPIISIFRFIVRILEFFNRPRGVVASHPYPFVDSHGHAAHLQLKRLKRINIIINYNFIHKNYCLFVYLNFVNYAYKGMFFRCAQLNWTEIKLNQTDQTEWLWVMDSDRYGTIYRYIPIIVYTGAGCSDVLFVARTFSRWGENVRGSIYPSLYILFILLQNKLRHITITHVRYEIN